MLCTLIIDLVAPGACRVRPSAGAGFYEGVEQLHCCLRLVAEHSLCSCFTSLVVDVLCIGHGHDWRWVHLWRIDVDGVNLPSATKSLIWSMVKGPRTPFVV